MAAAQYCGLRTLLRHDRPRQATDKERAGGSGHGCLPVPMVPMCQAGSLLADALLAEIWENERRGAGSGEVEETLDAWASWTRNAGVHRFGNIKCHSERISQGTPWHLLIEQLYSVLTIPLI